MSYASELGARRATRQELIDAGYKPSTRAYTLPSGEVVSHRYVQTSGLTRRYGVESPARALEERAELRRAAMAQPGLERREFLQLRSTRKTYDETVRNVAELPKSKGGLGWTYDARRGSYVDKHGNRHSTREAARTEEVQSARDQWRRIRHATGPKGQRQRFNWLKRHGFLERTASGKYRYVG